MSSTKLIEQSFIIDKLTDSILNTVSGDSFQTEVAKMTSVDLKKVTKKTGWNFDWKSEFNDFKEMNLIKEPKGVDFIIQSPPLTEQERIEISEFIASRKSKKNSSKRIPKAKISVKK